MTSTLTAGPRLKYPGRRPSGSVNGAGNGRGEWDWWYDLPTAEQNRLRYYMSGGGCSPDEWAQHMDFDDVEAAMREWQGMVAVARGDFDEWADLEQPEPDEELVTSPVIVRERVLGLGDLADHVGAKRATAYKWAHRGQLPPADLQVSGADCWYLSTVDAWAEAK